MYLYLQLFFVYLFYKFLKTLISFFPILFITYYYFFSLDKERN